MSLSKSSTLDFLYSSILISLFNSKIVGLPGFFFSLKPVAITVTLTKGPNSLLIPIPSIIFTFFPAASCIQFLILNNSDIFISSSPSPVTIFKRTC